jgi:hypothetical protein
MTGTREPRHKPCLAAPCELRLCKPRIATAHVGAGMEHREKSHPTREAPADRVRQDSLATLNIGSPRSQWPKFAMNIPAQRFSLPFDADAL